MPDDTSYENPFVAETYDSVVPYRTREDVQFFIEAARESGGPVLELGCGTGRVLIPTARAGIEITGLDASETMLGICRARLQNEPSQVRSRTRLVNDRIQDFDLGRTFRLVTIPFRPFQHLLTTNDQISCLRCVHAHLQDNGTLILDLFNPWIHRLIDETGKEFGEEPEFTMPDGRRIVRKHRTVSRDLFNQINAEEMIYEVTHPNGSTERIVEPFQMRYLYRFEAEHLLARCGFELQHVYADYKKAPYGETYPGELLLVAKRA
jgi:SAM-dependent methyltransferase